MWLLKLPLKIIALPVMAVVAVLSIFYSIALHLSSLVVGLGYLFLGVCIVVLLFQQMWVMVTNAIVADLKEKQKLMCRWKT